MQTFKNISITLPKEKMRQKLFYSTSKNWSKQYQPHIDFNKDQFLRQLSCSTQNNKTLKNNDLKTQNMKLQQKLNEKNQLLIKQSKWKNYYLKEQICVLLQNILQHLQLYQEERNFNKQFQFQTYRKKLQKMISKVQIKRRTQKNWIQFLGITPSTPFSPNIEQASVQTQQQIKQTSINETNSIQLLKIQITKVKQENTTLLKNLNILTQQIQIKQKQFINLQSKYIKSKQKKQKLKLQLKSLKIQYQQFVKYKQIQNHKFQTKQNFSIRKNPKNIQHFHTYYSWDKNFITHKQKSDLHSELNGVNIEQESSKLFTLSDTPFIIQKKKQIPISSGFIEVKKKLSTNQKQVLDIKSRKSISVNTNRSVEKVYISKQQRQNNKLEDRKRIQTDNKKSEYIQIQKDDKGTNSIIIEDENDELTIYRQLLLSQAITIENLLYEI